MYFLLVFTQLLPIYGFSEMPVMHSIFIMLNTFMWMMLYRCYNTNPGYLPKNSPDYDRAIRQVSKQSGVHFGSRTTRQA